MSKAREIANKLIDGMNDVTIINPVSGQALVYNGTAWVNNVGSGVGFKNYIINGNFDVWQKGTSFPSLGNSGSTYLADMSKYVSANTGQTAVFSVSRSTDAPKGSSSALQISCTTAQSSLNASDSALIVFPIEGINAKAIYGKTATISFNLKTNLIGTYDIVVSSIDRAYVKQITVPDTNWNTYSFSLLIDNSIGTWNNDTNLGLSLAVKLIGASNRAITKETWSSGSMLSASSGSINFASSTSNVMKIAQVQIEEGSVATPFEQRPYGLELSLCQRYYERIGVQGDLMANGSNTGTFKPRCNMYGTVPKRSSPSLTAVGSWVKLLGRPISSGSNTNIGQVTFANVYEEYCDFTASTGGFSSGSMYEIFNGSVIISAEL